MPSPHTGCHEYPTSFEISERLLASCDFAPAQSAWTDKPYPLKEEDLNRVLSRCPYRGNCQDLINWGSVLFSMFDL